MFSRTLSTDEEQRVSGVIIGYTITKTKPLLICDAQKQTHMPHFTWKVGPSPPHTLHYGKMENKAQLSWF